MTTTAAAATANAVVTTGIAATVPITSIVSTLTHSLTLTATLLLPYCCCYLEICNDANNEKQLLITTATIIGK